MIDYDSELQRHHQVWRRALDVRRGDHVLDIGCGTGRTTRDAASSARDGNVIGLDVAQAALRRARQLAFEAGLPNVGFVRGDAAHPPVPRAWADLAISRFGTMFFTEPRAAFTRIGQALRPGGRLAMMVWQGAPRNAWAVAIHRAVAGDDSLPPDSAAFSLGDPRATEDMLRAAAFTDIVFDAVREPVYYGPDVESASDFVSRFANVDAALASGTAAERASTIERLRATMALHLTHDGVWLDSQAWMVTALRA